MTLAQTALGRPTLIKQAGLVLGGSALIALAAQIAVPMWPVPMTLQTLAILVVALGLGSRLAVVTLSAYLAQGIAGLPVFANGGAGIVYATGPTGGFLLGFVLMAAVAGYAADRGWTASVIGAALTGLVASLLLYLPGLAWPAAILGKSWEALWSGWMAPFLVGDAIKAGIAALIVTGAAAALKARTG